MNRGLILFGVVALLVGAGTGYLIWVHPEGLNPAWPIWMAMLAPAVFTLGGLHMIAAGLGYPRVSGVMLAAIAVAFFAIMNWAAFFTTGFRCVETVSFLGVGILQRYPNEIDCRSRLQGIVGFVDALVVLPSLAFAWRKVRTVRANRER